MSLDKRSLNTFLILLDGEAAKGHQCHHFNLNISKVKCPDIIVDSRPITCCYVLYKCITKLTS